MLDPYKMVVVNLISSALLLLGVITYKYIYPKCNINLLFLLILISLLPLISILRKGSYESGDLNIHVGFAISFFESLKDGNLVPRWSSQMIYGYGYPLFLFTYPLPYYLASFFHFLGSTFIDSLKVVLAISFIASAITMYLFIKEELKNKFSAFTAALFYLFSPYHLVDLHFRVAIGETIAFAILPFCFFAIKKMSYNKTFFWFMASAISFSLLILSHQAISLASLPFISAYCIYLWIAQNRKEIKYILLYLFSLLYGMILSSFYWLPLIVESKYINLLSKGTVSFIQFNELFYSPWRWGFLFQGPNGELSLMVGYAQWLVIGLSFIFFLKKTISTKNRQIYFISIASIFILLIMTLSISNSIWSNISLLKGFQFSYRLLLLISFFTSIIAGIVVINIKNKLLLFLLCSIVVLTTILNWGNRKTLPQLNDAAIRYEFPKNMTKVGQSTTIWVDSNKFKSNKRTVSHIDVLQGKANISEIFRTSVEHEYLISVISKDASIKENTLYFPNWAVKVDGNPYPFSFKDTSSPGIITFKLNKGAYRVQVSFMDTNVRKISFLVSVLSFTTLLILGLKISLPKS